MTEEILSLSKVNFSYEPDEGQILNDISLSVKQGEWIALIGPNGSGKSTLAKVMNGLLVADSGQIKVQGTIMTEETIWDIRKAIGMVFQNPDNQFVGATVEDDVAFGLENNNVPREVMRVRVQEALEKVGMWKYRDHEPARLSGGQKQRVAVASIIALRPSIIILDEATAMLDPKGRQEIIALVDQVKELYDLTVISITHDIDEASRAQRIFVLNKGELVMQAPPEEVFALGEPLVSIGLDVPFSQRLAIELRQRGLEIPEGYVSREELEAWISQSYLTM